MKLSFTTLGCPKWDLAAIISRAKEYGFDAVDFRGYHGTIDLAKLPEFTTRLHETAQMLADGGLAVSSLSSSANILAGPEAADEVKAYARMCDVLGAPFIRIYGGPLGGASREQAVELAARKCKPMLAVAEDYNVTLLVETHDEWVDSSLVKMLLEAADSPALGALWDVHHPYRMQAEPPAITWRNVGRWVMNTHWKDSRATQGPAGSHQLCLMGKGDLPLAEIYGAVKNGGYDGWLTLEWEKHWHPELDEPEVAFPQYVEYMKTLMGE